MPGEYRDLALSIPGMRNILVHGYADVRHDLLYEALQTELDRLGELLLHLYSEAEKLDP